jgi:hypothetical protein
VTRHGETQLQRACRDAGLSDSELWLRYFALGGTAMPEEVSEYVRGTRQPEATEYDVVVHAINERYMELHRPDRLPYAPGA